MDSSGRLPTPGQFNVAVWVVARALVWRLQRLVDASMCTSQTVGKVATADAYGLQGGSHNVKHSQYTDGTNV